MITPIRTLLALALSTVPLHAQVSGVVMDLYTGLPVAGAIVSVQATTIRTTTAIDGSYLLAGAMGSNLTIVAAKKGYFNEGIMASSPSTAVHVSLEPVVIGFNPNYQFLSPQTCSACHPVQFNQWVNSPMGTTAANTWVHDLQNGTGTPGGGNGFVYLSDSAHLAFNSHGSCASCHQPEYFQKSLFTNPNGVGLELIPNLVSNPDAAHGVSCESCHKIADVNTNFTNSLGPVLPSATFNLPFDPINANQVEYGTLGDVIFRVDGLMRASYNPQVVAENCATCHQYSNDHDEDGDHEEASSPEGQATYEEWATSPYGNPASPMYATCVDCHMPAFGEINVCAIGGQPNRDPNTIRSHDIVGTTPEFLENAVDMTVNVVDNGATLAVQVDLANNHAGHKVPTGVSPRNMILIVEAWRVDDGMLLTDAGTQLVDEFGGVGARIYGNYDGVAGKTYGKINDDINGNAAPIFTEAVVQRFDTRIPPLATDTTNYTFNVPPGSGQVKVRARLIYRRAYKAIVDIKGWNLTGNGKTLNDIAPPYYGTLMEESQWTNGAAVSSYTYGASCGGVSIGTTSEPFMGNLEFGITATGGAPSVPALLLLGVNDNNFLGSPLPFDLAPAGAPGCFLWTSTNDYVMFSTDGLGNALLPLPLGPGFPGGITFFSQWIVFDNSNPFGGVFSDALAITTEP